MPRYDKYDPKTGGFRAVLAADWLVADLERVYGVGLDSSGRVVKGVGTTGVIGVLILTKARKAGEIVDVMTSGEIVEFCDTVQVPGKDVGVAGKPYFAHTSTASEVQSITFDGFTDGTFKLGFRGQTTTALDHDATASAVHDALEALSTIGSGQLTGGGGALDTAPVTMTFGGTLANVDVPLLTIAENNLVGAGTITIAATTEGHSASGEINSDGAAGSVCVGHTVEGGRLIVRVQPAAAAGSLSIAAIAATGTPAGSNYLKGDASWGTV